MLSFFNILAKGESTLDDMECRGCNVVNSRQENGSRDSVRWKAADGFGLTFWWTEKKKILDDVGVLTSLHQ